MVSLSANGQDWRITKLLEEHQERPCQIVELLKPYNGAVGEQEVLHILKVVPSTSPAAILSCPRMHTHAYEFAPKTCDRTAAKKLFKCPYGLVSESFRVLRCAATLPTTQ